MADSAQQKGSQSSKTMFMAIAVVVILGAAGFFWLDYSSRHVEVKEPVLTPEAKAYTRNLGLSEVAMKAHESYLKQGVVEITGKITNKGDRLLKYVEINCVFYDPYNQVVLRERVPIIGRRGITLPSSETRDFRLAFDNIPESWNQRMPQLVIAQINFGE